MVGFTQWGPDSHSSSRYPSDNSIGIFKSELEIEFLSEAGQRFASISRGPPFLHPALWDEWKDRATGETLKSCAMIITEPNDFVADVHDRMPVILDRANFGAWSNDGGTALLKPAANEVLQRWPVSRRVNSSKARPPRRNFWIVDKVNERYYLP
jgi:putative SOS response-associated peptidase YedK